jgi:hypothetical protein
MFLPKLPSQAVIPVALLAAFLTGCPPKIIAPPRPGDTAETVLSRLENAEARVQRVRGEARLKAEGKDGKLVVTVFVAAEAPARIHLEQLDFFGRPERMLACDGTRFVLFDGQKAKWYRGPATEATMARFFPVTLSPPELAALLMGLSPRLKPIDAKLSTDEKRGTRLTLVSETRTDALFVGENDRVALAELGPPLSATLEYSEWTESNGVLGPRRTVLDRAGGAMHLELAWKEQELNGAPDPSMFELTIPEGIVPIELDGRGEERSAAPGANP